MNVYLRIFVLLLLLSNCSEAPTSLRIHLIYEQSWSLDRVELSLADLSDSVNIADELTIFLPEETTGKLHTLHVSAYRGEERYAYGAVEVIPVLHQEVAATITLTRLPCGAWCTEGQTECRKDGVVVCEQRDDDHCFEWSESVPCPSDSPYCSLGQCAPQCIDECAEGEQRCAGPGSMRVCGQGDSDSCLEWLDETPCSGGESCSAGMCLKECVDECTFESIECSGAGFRECGDLNFDGCTEWGPTISCPEDQSCSDGTCTPNEECEDECAQNECTELAYHECGQFDRDPCLDRSPGTSCVARDPCFEGHCSEDGCRQTSIVCVQSNEPECINATTLRSFEREGSCSDGECHYSFVDTTCEGQCSEEGGGHCVDSCAAEECEPETVFGDAPEDVWKLLLDDTHVYWIHRDDGRIVRQLKTGGSPETLVTGEVEISALAIDDSHVYWSNFTTNQIKRIAKTGGDAELLADEQAGPISIAVDDTHVYWSNQSNQALMRAPKGGGASEVFVNRAEATLSIAIDETHVYWSENARGVVARKAKAGGDPEDIAQGGAFRVALDDTHVYWTVVDGGTDRVRRRRKESGRVQTIAMGPPTAFALVLDDTYVYWTNLRNGIVFRTPKAGGDNETIASAQTYAGDVAFDENHIYWTKSFGDQIVRLSRCACEL